jgi:guanine deaminase
MENQAKEKFMRIAIELSELNIKQGNGGPFGAVVVKDGILIAKAPIRLLLKMILLLMPRYLLSGWPVIN